ncbi:MAG: hypothetical protein HRU16_03035 [Planctomycetes bacterium]|nr:hypothetical protein [Planctomycetota bacterium]
MRLGLLLVLLGLLSMDLGCVRNPAPGGYFGAGNRIGGTNDTGDFWEVTVINDYIPAGDDRPTIRYGLIRCRPAGQTQYRWFVPWVLVDLMMMDVSSFGGPSTSGKSKTVPYLIELNRTFEYDQVEVQFSWSADCSGTVPVVASFMVNGEPIDLAEGPLVFIQPAGHSQVEVDQRHWQGDFQQLALGATGKNPPSVDLLADAILTELGY